jgi:hypothetical protein
MKFRTEVTPNKCEVQIEHYHNIITFGSCFAENISEYFEFHRFNILNNPFGVLYNPASILNSINLLKEGKQFAEADLFQDQDEWHSFFHHSDFSHHELETCLNKINNQIISTFEYLRKADFVIITFGTSFVFKSKSKNIIVSNCHKIPQKEFNRFRLTLEATTNYIMAIIESIQEMNRETNIIFTVSPVRHWRDGAVENHLSKSTLLLAIDEVLKSAERCSYFPSYEIVMDDLRDYRFYAADLLHPNKAATDYIWEKFTASYFSDKCLNLMNEIKSIAEAALHRPRNIESKTHQKFVKTQLRKIHELEQKFTHLNLANDKEYFKSQIKL